VVDAAPAGATAAASGDAALDGGAPTPAEPGAAGEPGFPAGAGSVDGRSEDDLDAVNEDDLRAASLAAAADGFDDPDLPASAPAPAGPVGGQS
jgi:hypothetical protein